MTLKDKIKQYEKAIKQAEESLDNPNITPAAADATEEAITSLSNKLIEFKHELRLIERKQVLDGKLI